MLIRDVIGQQYSGRIQCVYKKKTSGNCLVKLKELMYTDFK